MRRRTGRVLLVCALFGCASEEGTEAPTDELAQGLAIATVGAVEDARVEEANPNSNFADNIYLGVYNDDLGNDKRSFLKFTVGTLSGQIQNARLRLYVSDATTDGPRIFKTSNSWSESTLTWANRPLTIGAALDDLGYVHSGGYVEYDVSSVITQPGTYSFILLGDIDDNFNARSMEDISGQQPELRILYAPHQFRYVATEDARVESANPSTNYGNVDPPLLKAGSTPDIHSFIKFTVSGFSGSVEHARLRLYVSDATDNGPRVYATSSSWAESTITWNNQPSLGTAGPNALLMPSQSYYEYDVTSLVSGNGTYSFALIPDGTNVVNIRSSEAPIYLKPELLILSSSEPSPGATIGTFNLTHYWVAIEEDFTGDQTTPLYDDSCQVLAMVRPGFATSVKTEGTGRLLDGRTINFTDGCPWSCDTQCFFVLDDQFPWGMGSFDNPLTPLRSIAIDPASDLDLGETYYIQQLDNLHMPGTGPEGGFVHDGCVTADDVGYGVYGNHVDFFAAKQAWYSALVTPIGSSVTVKAGGARCP